MATASERPTVTMAPVYTTGRVAKVCGVAPRTVSAWFDSGRLKGYRIPGSQDRRVGHADLMQFIKEHGMPVPAWMEPARLAYGVPAADVPAGWTLCGSMFDLATAVAAEPGGVGALVIGDGDGTRAAVEIAARVPGRHPAAELVLVVDPGVPLPVEGWPGRVLVRSLCDVAAAFAGAA